MKHQTFSSILLINSHNFYCILIYTLLKAVKRSYLFGTIQNKRISHLISNVHTSSKFLNIPAFDVQFGFHEKHSYVFSSK